MKLAKLLNTVVSGTEEDQRMLSLLKFEKKPCRTRLQDKNLELCLRLKIQNLFTRETSPFRTALAKWLAMSSRCKYIAV